MIEIDGSFGSGSGQILRTSLALSAILGVPFRIKNIRAKRPKPGLMPQHLTGVMATRRLCAARVEGATPGSTELLFEPGQIKPQDLSIDVAAERGSAGSATLVIQTILPVMLFAPGECTALIKGGTHVPFSPPYEYLKLILLPVLNRMGFSVEVKINSWGFYPVGGGELLLNTRPVKREKITGIQLSLRGGLKQLQPIAGVSHLPLSIAHRAVDRLRKTLGFDIADPQIQEVPAKSPGAYLFLAAFYDNSAAGFLSLGKKGKPAELLGEEVSAQFHAHHQTAGAIDPNLADQLLIFLALSGQPSSFTTSRVTDHLQTNIWTIKRFLPEIPLNLTINDDRSGEVIITP